jgi:hypothetical protein
MHRGLTLPDMQTSLLFFTFAFLACIARSDAGALSLHPEETIYGSHNVITLSGNSSDSSIATIDYGGNVEGYPTFQILAASGDTSGLQVSYSEDLSTLNASPTVRST